MVLASRTCTDWLETARSPTSGPMLRGAGASNSSGTYTSPNAFCNHKPPVLVPQ